SAPLCFPTRARSVVDDVRRQNADYSAILDVRYYQMTKRILRDTRGEVPEEIVARLENIAMTIKELFKEGDELMASVETKRLAVEDEQLRAAETVVHTPYGNASPATREAIAQYLKRAEAGDVSIYSDADYQHLVAWQLGPDDRAQLQTDIAALLAQ